MMDRVSLIRQRLSQTFNPTLLEVRDDSDKHKGHAGAAGGAGHYSVTISAFGLASLSRVDAHRQIYAVFNDLIPHEIHALRIKIVK